MNADITISRRLVLLAGTLFACLASRATAQDLAAAIGAANDRFMEAFAAGDAQAVARLYTEDAKLLPPGSDAVEGRAAIAEFWRAVIMGGVARVSLNLDEVHGSGDWAYELSRWAMYDADGGAVGEGKYIVIWRRTAEGWRLHRDIWN